MFRKNSIQRLLKLKKFIFWINACTPIKNQSNQDWHTQCLKNNGPHITVPLIFWFLIVTFNLYFHQQLCVKWICIHIRISSGHIGQIHLQFPKCVWMFDTEWNAHQISTLYNLFDKTTKNISTRSKKKNKKKNAIVYSTYNSFVYLSRSFNLLEI